MSCIISLELAACHATPKFGSLSSMWNSKVSVAIHGLSRSYAHVLGNGQRANETKCLDRQSRY